MKKIVISLLCCLTALPILAQITVTGTVYDENNETLPQAVIRLKSQPQTATLTDMNGHFSLNIPNQRAVLTVSYMGYETQEVNVGAKRQFRITLQPSKDLMQEVVVVGFGTQKKVNLTGAVKTVGDEVFADRPISNALQGLQGAIGGLNITNDAGGGLGEQMNINIRGVGSIGDGSNSSPLILIDGMEGDLSTINPSDIETISVLKDGASASIYGSRAPFGVILVTTKRGTKKGINVRYTGNLRLQQPVSVPKMVDSYSYALMVNEAAMNSGFGSGLVGRLDEIKQFQNGELQYATTAQDDLHWWGADNSFGNTDWYDLYLKNVTSSLDNNVTLSGTHKKLDYYASIGYMNQTGLFKYADEKYNRLSANIKLGYQINKYMKLTVNSRIINIDNNKPSALNDLFYHNLGRRAPTLALVLPNDENSRESMLHNIEEGGRWDQKTRQFYNQANLVIEPIKNWQIHGEVNSRIERNPFTRSFNPIGVHAPNGDWTYFEVLEGVTAKHNISGGDTGYFQVFPDAGEQYNEEAQTKISYFGTNIYTDYNLTLADKHKFTFLVGEQSEYYHRKIQRDAEYYLVTDPNAEVRTMSVFKNGEWASLGFFGRVNYNYANRYLLELNARADTASRFPSNQRWGFFPSISAGWNIAEEPFWKKLSDKGFEFLKLRASYATLGNQNTTSFYPYYQKMLTYPGNVVLGGERATILPMYAAYSTSLTWETIENAGIGLDFAFLNNRLTGSFDWYQRKTKDMVGPANALSALYGASAPKTNNAELRTRGWEVELGWRDRIGKNFSYSISATLSDYNTVITKYDSPDNNIYSWYEGKKYGEIWGYEVEGIAKSDAEMNAYLAEHSQSAIGDRWGGGDLMYRDQNNDGAVNAGSSILDDHGDLVVIGNTTPRYAYSFTLTAQWKWIDFRAYFQGIGKRDYFFNTATFFGMVAPYQRSLYVEHLDYFRYAGSELGANYEDPYYPRLRADQNNTQTSDRYLQNASYLRLKNLQVGFNIPMKKPNRKFIKKARLYLSGENLLTWTKLRLFDPEAIKANVTDYDGGAGKTYPQYRTYSMGVEIQF